MRSLVLIFFLAGCAVQNRTEDAVLADRYRNIERRLRNGKVSTVEKIGPKKYRVTVILDDRMRITNTFETD